MSEELAVANALLSLNNSKPVTGGTVVTGIFDDIGGVIGQVVTPLIQKVLDKLNTQVTDIKNAVGDSIKSSINGIIDGFKGVANTIAGVIRDAVDKLTDTIASIIDYATSFLNGLIDALFSYIDAIKAAITGLVNSLRDALKNIVADLIDGLRRTITGIVNNVGDWIRDVIDNVKGYIANVIEAARSWIGGVIDNVKDWISNIINHLKQTYETVKTTVEEWFSKLIAWLIEVRDNILEFIRTALQNAAKFFAEVVMPAFAKAVEWSQKVTGLDERDLEKIKNGDLSPLQSAMGKLGGEFGNLIEASPIYAMLYSMAYAYNQIDLAFTPSKVAASTWAQIGLQVGSLDLVTASRAVYKGSMSDNDYFNNAYLSGISADKARAALEANRGLPTPGQIQDAFLRGQIDLETHDNLLRAYGLTDEHIQLIKSLYLIIPGPSDLIRMAVREAFSPDIAEAFGQYQDYPKEFTEWAVKIGLSEDWAKRYWAAHWDLPSPTMGFEMLHRGIIDENELRLLLRALDVMPYWRERLIKLSYNPLTRVDIRRMYKMGVIDEAQVYRAYLDLGYDNEKATWLTEFTKRYSTPEDSSELTEFRTMARSTYSQAYRKQIISNDEYREFLRGLGYADTDVDLLVSLDDYAINQQSKLFDINDYRKDLLKMTLTAYDRGLYSYDDAKAQLSDLGYTDDEIILELDIADYNRTMRVRNMVVEAMHDQYVAFIIDDVQVNELMSVFNFMTDEIQKLLEEWTVERNLRSKRPPVTDLKRFLNAGLITLDQFLDELRGMGYHEKYISLYAQTLA